MKPLLILACLITLATAKLGQKVYFTELETLNSTQKEALEKLKQSTASVVTDDYMKDDIYLVKWLQATSFNPQKADEMLKNAIKWRTDNKVGEWENQDYFSGFEQDYQRFQDGFDKEGRPIGEAFYGDWNIRAAALSGKMKNLTLYSLRNVERSTKKIRELQKEGKNVTQWTLLLNMEGFNLIKHACPACLSLYLGFTNQYEKVWPNTIYRTILVNTPESFEVILKLIFPLMSPQTKASLKVFGNNKAEWKKYLDEMINPEEISDWFGGKKERKHL